MFFDDLSTGAMENIRPLKERPGFAYTIDSASAPGLVAELVDEADVVFHLAAAVGVELIVESPVRTIETNVHCTEIVLAAANKKKKPVSSARPARCTARARTYRFARKATCSSVQRARGGGRTQCSKAVEVPLGLAYFRERQLPVTVSRVSTRLALDRRGGAAWSSRGSWDKRFGVSDRRLRRRDAEALLCHVADVVRAMADLVACDSAAA